MAFGFLLLVSLAVSALLNVLAAWAQTWRLVAPALQLLNELAGFAICAALFAGLLPLAAALYFSWSYTLRVETLHLDALAQQALLRDTTGGMFVVSATELQYHRPARLDDLLTVTASARETGRASLTIAQSAWRHPAGDPAGNAADPELLCEGSIRIGWVDAASLRPARMPASVLQALAAP